MTGERTQPRRPWWLNRAAAISLVGLAFSVIFAAFVGWYIPRRVAEDFLASQSAADQASLDFLVSSDTITTRSSLDLDELESFVRQSILRGDFVRAKLWAVDGTVLYSDATELIGQRFTPDEDFEGMRRPVSEVSDLTEEENYLEAAEFGGLLETYVPVLDGDRVVAVWEIYRTLDAYNESVDQTQRLVWLGMGSALGLLGLFLVSSLGLLVRTADEQRQEAELRAEDLVTTLQIARAASESEGVDELAGRLQPILDAAPQLRWAEAILEPKDAEPRVLLSVGERPGSLATSVAATESPEGTVMVRMASSGGESSDPTIDALAGEALLGFVKVMLSERLSEHRRRLEEVMKQLVDAEESQRRRLAGDVHDSVARDLYRVLYGVRALAAEATEENRSGFEDLEAAVLDTSSSLRTLLRDLYPTVAEDVGLAAALASLADRIGEEYGLTVDLDIDRCPDPSRDVRLAVYRVAQEALVNAARHSGTDRAMLAVWQSGNHLEFSVSDRGTGPDDGWGAGMGIWLMRDRVERLGGHLDFQIGDGLVVAGSIPIGDRS